MDAVTANAAPLSRSLHSLGDAYLRFQLDAQTPAAILMEQVQDVLVVPAPRVTPMPNMPLCVLGLLNRRSRVLWVIDLSQLLKAQPLDTNRQRYNLIIARVGQVPLGLVVQEIQGIVRFGAEAIRSPVGTVSFELTPYLRGCVPQQTETLWILDVRALVQASRLQGD